MIADALLRADDVTVRFGGVVALDGVSISAPASAIVGLVGPNGAGKTTLFGVLSGLVRPRSGRVLLRGVDVTSTSPQRRSRLGLARTFQRIELFAELTVREHLVVAHRAHERRDRRFLTDLAGLGSRPPPRERELVAGLLDLLGLTALADRPAALLPLGTGRLVEVARALATEPAIVLLDEPTSGLDAGEAERLATALERTRADLDVAFVLVEHNVDFVLGLAEHVTVLDFGKVIAAGAPAAIRADEAVQAAYLGTSTGAGAL
ncbi:MAG TPA: ATP-binding cassette domain-containing protein [Acidimicrobiia bacterium]|nr:ATP-binding cassette domain-containing protein [Acidimicrobiia bacterium]